MEWDNPARCGEKSSILDPEGQRLLYTLLFSSEKLSLPGPEPGPSDPVSCSCQLGRAASRAVSCRGSFRCAEGTSAFSGCWGRNSSFWRWVTVAWVCLLAGNSQRLHGWVSRALASQVFSREVGNSWVGAEETHTLRPQASHMAALGILLEMRQWFFFVFSTPSRVPKTPSYRGANPLNPKQCLLPSSVQFLFFKKTFIFRERGRREEKHPCEREISICFFLHPSHHVPWPGIELVTFCFAAQCPTHSATPVRALFSSKSWGGIVQPGD